MDLDERMLPKVNAFLNILKERKIPYRVTSDRRTDDVQVAYYFQGRVPLRFVNILRKKARLYLLGEKANHYTVTNIDGVNDLSMHQRGLAIDVVPAGETGQPVWPPLADKRWLELGEIGESVGLVWGGRWPTPDLPHYEYREV